MATSKGRDFIDKYKNKGVNKDTWFIMYRKGHIELDELVDCVELTDKEVQELKNEQIDNLPKIKTNEELTKENEQLWETVEFLLKNTGFIPSEEV